MRTSSILIITVISYFTILVKCDPSVSDPDGPILTLGYGEVSSWESIGNGSGIIARKKSNLWELEISCQAAYPMEWIITGHIMPPEFVKIQPSKLISINATDSTFELRMIIFFNPVDNCYSSSMISCQRISTPIVKSSIQVFVPGDDKMLLRPSSEAELILNDETLIPCPTTDPTVPVTLSKKLTDGTEEILKDAIYDPITGFQVNEPIDGKLICSAGDDKIIFDSIVSEVKIEGDNYFPKTGAIKAFTSEKMVLNCSSSQETVQLVTDLDLKYLLKSDKNLQAEVTGQIAQNGTVQCNGANSRSIWTLEIQLIDPPELYLDNFEGEVNCLSDSPNKSVSTIRCGTPSNCKFMKHCFKNASYCNFKRQKQFYSNFQTRCWIQEKKSGAYCTSVPYSHLNGIAECSVSGLKRQWEFFTALNFRKYSNWENVAKRDLIRMDQVPQVLPADQPAEFFCEAVAYLFLDSLKFSIEFQNGTVEFFNELDYHYINPGKENPRKMDDLNVLGHLKINLPIDAVAIKCHAPWWNSTEFLRTERRFTVKDTQLEGGNGSINGTCPCEFEISSNVV